MGRQQVLNELREAFTAVLAGTSACVIMEGPAGIGKSRLLAEAVKDGCELGMLVATGRATELDRIAPLTTLLVALLGAQPPVLTDGDMAALHRMRNEPGNGFWIVSHLSIQLEKYAASRPLLIALDDFQWADELTVLALRILVPALRSSQVLWLLASRPPAGRSPNHELIDWLAGEGARRLSLEPLSDDAAVELSTQLLGARPGEDVLPLIRRAGGSPFLLEELITAFQRTGRSKMDLAADVLQSVGNRLRYLSRTARQVLDAGAVLGPVFTLSEVAAVVGSQPGEIHDAVAEIVDEGVLIGSGAELEFRHELIRDAVYSQLTESARRALHREAGRVLLGQSRPVIEVVTHLLRGARPGDVQTIGLLQQAALDLASSAPSTAADLMLQVLGLVDERDPARPSLVATTVRLLASASRLAEARELGEAALRFRLPDAAQAAMLLGLAEALKHAGQDADAVRYAGRALARPGIPGPLRAQLLAVQAHAMLAEGDVEDADRAGAEAIEVGTTCDECSAVVFGIVARSGVAQSQARIADAIALADEGVRLADLSGGEARHRHPRLWLARALMAADRLAEAGAVLDLDERETRTSGAVWSLPFLHLLRTELRLAAGDLDDAQAEAESGVAVCEQLAARALAPSLHGLLSRIAIHRGDVTAARDHLRRAHAHADLEEGGRGEANAMLWCQALLHEALGEPQAAVQVLAPLYASLPSRAMLLTLTPSIGPHLVRLARQTGHLAQARTAAAATREVAERNRQAASLSGAAAHAEGLLRGDLGLLREAVHRYQASPRRLARASVLEDAGLAASAAGERGEAVGLLEQAREQYAAAGARRDAARLEQRLRTLGVRRRPRRPPVVARLGPASLTESEQRVVELVAEGLTNRAIAERLFLSPHTVDAHLRHAFTKLGVSSRVELTRAVLLDRGGP